MYYAPIIISIYLNAFTAVIIILLNVPSVAR